MNDFYRKFAEFYELKYGLGAREKIISLEIKDIIFYSDNNVQIHLGRPGLIIGPKCESINKLQDFVAPYKIKIVEVPNSPVYNILNCLNDRCLICDELVNKELKCEDLNSDANFCSDKCRDEYIKEQSIWD